jgi:hypothetical protein
MLEQHKGKGNKEILRFQTWKMGNEEITCKIDESATWLGFRGSLGSSSNRYQCRFLLQQPNREMGTCSHSQNNEPREMQTAGGGRRGWRLALLDGDWASHRRWWDWASRHRWWGLRYSRHRWGGRRGHGCFFLWEDDVWLLFSLLLWWCEGTSWTRQQSARAILFRVRKEKRGPSSCYVSCKI